MRGILCILSLGLCLCFASERSLADVMFMADYSSEGATEGFNDPTLGAMRRTAFEHALGIWSSALQENYVGETVVVSAVFNPLGGSAGGATLGFAGPTGSGFVAGNPQGPNVFFSGAVRNHLSGSDQSAGNEITSTFNSDVDGSVVLGATTWYYGTDGNPTAGTIDFVQTALHEIGHGLGFAGTMVPLDAAGNRISNPALIGNAVGAGYLNGGTFRNSFDRWVVRDSDGTLLSDLSEADRLAAIQGDDIAWSGANGVAANGGTRPDLYGPNPWVLGSTYSHLDEGDFASELMSPISTAGTANEISALTRGILMDVGWTFNAVPEPSSFVLILIGSIATLRRRRH